MSSSAVTIENTVGSMAFTPNNIPRIARRAGNSHDPMPNVKGGTPIKVSVEADPRAGVLTVDLRDNPDCVAAGINLTESTATTAAMVGDLQ